MGKKYPNLLSGGDGGGRGWWGENRLSVVRWMGKGWYSKSDVKHNFFGRNSWEKHTQEGVKPL